MDRHGLGFLTDSIGWLEQNNSLQIEMRPKGDTSASVQAQFVNATKMVCLNGNYVKFIFSLLSTGFSSFRSRREAEPFKLGFMCEGAELKCVGSTCSFCTDIKLTNRSVSTREKIFSCTPHIDVVDWVKSNVKHYWTKITNVFSGGAEPKEAEEQQSVFTSLLRWLI
ncbi:unnamed protein product [Cylicocyclus nassatus]|uniref:Uncharacterized protein n=1 Tax=Cylicocyclus nassatus TaxID=53992 RepID=A0AA36GJ68_CYLNA|nr:unnamed protein product [Cylicocyclus nassatus]